MNQSHHTSLINAYGAACDRVDAAQTEIRRLEDIARGGHYATAAVQVHMNIARNELAVAREAEEEAHGALRASPDTADILAAGRHRIPVERLAQSGKPLLALSTNHWQTVLDALWDASERYWNAHEDPYDPEQRRLQDAYADLVRQLTD